MFNCWFGWRCGLCRWAHLRLPSMQRSTCKHRYVFAVPRLCMTPKHHPSSNGSAVTSCLLSTAQQAPVPSTQLWCNLLGVDSTSTQRRCYIDLQAGCGSTLRVEVSSMFILTLAHAARCCAPRVACMLPAATLALRQQTAAMVLGATMPGLG